jgi:hypothetical protein
MALNHQNLKEFFMPPLPLPLPLPPEPGPGPMDPPQQSQVTPARSSERALVLDVPRYFVDVRVPGYDVAKTVARARKRQPLKQQQESRMRLERDPVRLQQQPASTAGSVAADVPDDGV